MFQFPLLLDGDRRHILVLGSQSDDIEIGCGATLLALMRAHPDLDVTWVMFGAQRGARGRGQGERAGSPRGSRALEGDRPRVSRRFFPYVGGEIKDVFEELKARVDPDIIFTHTRHDLHQDHGLVCELTGNTWPDHLIVEYEIRKYDGDLATPNVFVSVPEELAREKADLIMRVFES